LLKDLDASGHAEVEQFWVYASQHSLRFLGVLCVSAVFLLLRGNCGSSQTKHRRDAENAEEAQRKIELPFIFVVRRQGDLVLNKEHKEQSRQKI